MVHNGIEYGDMQLIAEAYHLLKGVLGLSNQEIANVFAEWNKGDLDSYLIEVSTYKNSINNLELIYEFFCFWMPSQVQLALLAY